MALKFRRGTTAQKSGSLAFGEPYVNTTLGTLQIGLDTGDVTLSATGTGSNLVVGGISGSSLDITGNAKIDGNLSLGGQLTIGDQTSDTLNVVASLSSSLIPQITNAFDLGTADKIWRDLYISTGSIKFVEGNTVVKTLNANTITALEAATGSSNASFTNLNSTTASLLIQTSNLESFSSSTLTRLDNLEIETSNLESFSSSTLTRLNTIESTTASLNSSVSDLTQRIAANEAVSSSYVRNNSANTLNGNQTISGSLTVTQDLTVLGSSSIQTISSSNLVIGAAYVTLNTFSPSSRYAGLEIIDSGSSPIGSGSFLYDAVHDEFIFVHKGNGTNVTSSHFVLGPETYDNLGNENYLTNNRLPKGTGKEHLTDSNITDTGTLITLGSNSVVNGTFYATGTTLVSGSSQIDVSSTTGDIALGSRTSGNYVASLVAGTGVTITNNSGEGTTPTIAIGQSVATNATPTFGNLTINGTITATGDITAYFTSDKRHKNNIQLIPNALEKVSKLNGVTWEWNDDVNEVTKSTPKTGLIAQEVQEVLPQVVVERDNGYLGLDYSKMMGLLVEAIKEQQTQIHNLTLEIENLKKQKGL